MVNVNPVFGLAIESGLAYIGVWHSGSIIEVNLDSLTAVVRTRSVAVHMFNFASGDSTTQKRGKLYVITTFMDLI